MFSVELSRRAEKFVGGLQKDIARRIIDAAESFGNEPFPRGAIKLKGESNAFRIRVGDYRIVYEIHNERNIVLIARIDKRSRVYENL